MNTLTHRCAANGHVEVMQFILNQKGCDPNIQTKLGNTAAHLAALNSREEACKLLINNGVSLGVRVFVRACVCVYIKAYIPKYIYTRTHTQLHTQQSYAICATYAHIHMLAGVDLKKKNKSGKTAADLCPEESSAFKAYLHEQTHAEQAKDGDDDSEFGEV